MITCLFKHLRITVAAGALVLVVGCSDEAVNGFSLLPQSSSPPASARALSQAQMAGGDITLRAPENWCIEPRSLRNKARGSFALLASCHEMTEGKVGTPLPAGYMTVVVGPRQVTKLDDTDILSASIGDAKIDRRETIEGIGLVRLGDVDEGEPRWRGALTIDRRPVLLAAFAPDASALGDGFGARLLAQIGEDMRAAFAAENVVTADTQKQPERARGLDAEGLFGRLLGRKVSE